MANLKTLRSELSALQQRLTSTHAVHEQMASQASSSMKGDHQAEAASYDQAAQRKGQEIAAIEADIRNVENRINDLERQAQRLQEEISSKQKDLQEITGAYQGGSLF